MQLYWATSCATGPTSDLDVLCTFGIYTGWWLSLLDGNGAYRENDLRIYWKLNSSITVEVIHCIFKKRSFGDNSSCSNQLSVGVSDSVFISDSTALFKSTNFTRSGGYLDIVPSYVYNNRTSFFKPCPTQTLYIIMVMMRFFQEVPLLHFRVTLSLMEFAQWV